MKLLINGVWHSNHTDSDQLRAVRERTARQYFHNQITADGSSGFKAESGRYHLYVSYACPWAHRTILLRKLKKLEDTITMSVLDPAWGGPDGWVFSNSPDCTLDTVNGYAYLHQVYTQAKPDFTGKVSVPVLWDKRLGTIVNNESSEIIRMFNHEFNAFGDPSVDLYPVELRAEIDEINTFVLDHVNNGVYKAGFASSQADYETAFDALFAALDSLETQLSHRQYLVREQLTEADLRLFVTLVRFDAVYYGAFNCNLRRLVDYPNLWNYTRRLYHLPGIAETVKLDHIKRHYYDEELVNRRIVPKGPLLDFGVSRELVRL